MLQTDEKYNAMVNFIVVAFLLHCTYAAAFQDESLPYHSTEDDPMYLYMDTRSTKDTEGVPDDSDIETRRRSVLEKNFFRFGRRDPVAPIRNNYDMDYDDYVDEFTRQTRSGNTNKSDKFVRFGRGRSDFVRFGRNYDMERDTRGGDSNFIRFGRSSDESKKRSKRDVSNADYKRHGSNFLRFGRNSNFLRFGRIPYQGKDDETSSTIPTIISDPRQSELVEQLSQYPRATMYRLLAALSYKLKQSSKCTRLVE